MRNKKEKFLFIIIMAIINVFLYSQFTFSQTLDPGKAKTNLEILKAELATLNLDNPVEDMEKNFAAGDKSFVGIHGFSIMCPGVPDEIYRAAFASRMIRPIKGTSDVITLGEYSDLLAKAVNYARIYNEALLKKLK